MTQNDYNPRIHFDAGARARRQGKSSDEASSYASSFPDQYEVVVRDFQAGYEAAEKQIHESCADGRNFLVEG